jgi:hypothetical protein
MKKHSHLRLFILGFVILGLLFSHCGESKETSMREMVEKLVKSFNNRLPGTTFKTDLEKAMVKSAGDNNYWITFKNSTLTTDLLRLLKLLNMESPLKNEEFSAIDTARIEESVLLYNPGKKYLVTHSLKGLTVEHRVPPFEGNQQIPNVGELEVEKVQFYIGYANMRDIDISALVKDIKNSPGEVKDSSSDKGDTFPHDIIFEDMKGEIHYTLNKKVKFSALVEIEKFTVDFGTENPYLNAYLSGKNVPTPDLDKTLQKGMKFMDLGIDMGEIKFSIKRGGHQWDLGTIDNISFSSSITPDEADETKKFFKFGYKLGIKNVRVNFPLKQEIEKLANVKELRFSFFVEHLSPTALLGLMKFSNAVIELRDLTDSAKVREVMFQNMAFLFEVFQSKPVLKFSISPLKHYLGELSAEATIRSFLPPHAEININVLKIEKILGGLEGLKLFSPAFLKTIAERVATLFVIEQNGDASMIIEYKPDMPGMIVLNGRAFKIPDSVFNSLFKSPMQPFGF